MRIHAYENGFLVNCDGPTLVYKLILKMVSDENGLTKFFGKPRDVEDIGFRLGILFSSKVILVEEENKDNTKIYSFYIHKDISPSFIKWAFRKLGLSVLLNKGYVNLH